MAFSTWLKFQAGISAPRFSAALAVLVNEMPTLAVTVWFFVVSKVRYRPPGFVAVVCGAAAALVPCTVG